MMSITHKMTLGILKNKTSWIIGNVFAQKQKKYSFFAGIATKPVELFLRKKWFYKRG